jgi:hypothetical protein
MLADSHMAQSSLAGGLEVLCFAMQLHTPGSCKETSTTAPLNGTVLSDSTPPKTKTSNTMFRKKGRPSNQGAKRRPKDPRLNYICTLFEAFHSRDPELKQLRDICSGDCVLSWRCKGSASSIPRWYVLLLHFAILAISND